ncbi:hypothetical protein GCM10022265_15670 [Marinobacter xestospongiae]
MTGLCSGLPVRIFCYCGQAFGPDRPVTGREDDLTTPIPIGDDPARKGSIAMAWILLILAGLFEVGWAVGLKYTEGFTRLWPSVWTIAAMALSFGLLSVALKSLPLGTAYGVWVGIGAIGTVLLGMVLLGETASLARIVSVLLIVAGIIGLKLATP